MSKQVYISADYSEDSGDRDVVEILNQWGTDNMHKVDFIDMSKVVSGSVSSDPDCRICDLKNEFNKQINASSAVILWSVIKLLHALREVIVNGQIILNHIVNVLHTSKVLMVLKIVE